MEKKTKHFVYGQKYTIKIYKKKFDILKRKSDKIKIKNHKLQTKLEKINRELKIIRTKSRKINFIIEKTFGEFERAMRNGRKR